MCGISGVFYKSEVTSSLVSEQLDKMNQVLEHRGPDNAGSILFDRSLESDNSDHSIGGLAHRRLSIIDLSSAGNQPMSTSNRQMVITYNGEIFNFQSLISELNMESELKSNSDTEVLLNAYKKSGTKLYESLEGMWAFAILDKPTNRLILSRDRTGVKPLYYRFTGDKFEFASEMKALIEPNEKLNLPFLRRMFADNVFHQLGQTPFKNICEVLPGHELILDLNSFTIDKRSYFQIEVNHEAYQEVSEQELIQQADELSRKLKESIKLHAISDVPIGSCLSGGLDSGTIVNLLDQLGFNNLKVFTSTFPGFENNEEQYVRSLVEKLELDWTKSTPLGKDIELSMEDLVYTHEYPLLSLSTFAQYKLMETISKTEVKVILDGQGADELLGGYNRYFSYLSRQLIAAGKVQMAMNLPGSVKRSAIDLAKQGIKKLAPEKVESAIYRKQYFDYEALNPDFIKANDQFQEAEIEGLNDYLFTDYFKGYLTSLLRTEDRNSMRFSIESRVPFADSYELSKFVFGLPSGYKISSKGNKILLRKMIEEHQLLTDQIRDREDKLGYAIPSNQWMYEHRENLVKYLDYIPLEIADSELLKTKWLNQVDVKKGDIEEDLRLFKWVSFGAWLKVFSPAL